MLCCGDVELFMVLSVSAMVKLLVVMLTVLVVSVKLLVLVPRLWCRRDL